MAASKWKRPTMARLPAGSGAASRCSGICRRSDCWIRSPANCCGSTCASSAAAIGSKTKTRRTPFSTQQLLSRAAKAGTHIGALCQALHQRQGPVAVRRILGVLSLAKKYGIASADDACAMALETGACEYRFVLRYLERNPQLPLSLRQVDPLIRQLTLYRDLIENRTRQENPS